MTTVSRTRAPDLAPGRAFALKWAGLTALGFVVGGYLGLQLLWSATGAFQRTLGDAAGGALGALLFGAVVGLLTGALQALALLDRRPFAVAWVLASALGPALTVAIIYALIGPRELPGLTGALVIGTALGVGVGAGQATRLRSPSAAVAWAAFTLAAILLGWLTIWLLSGANQDLTALGAVVGALVAGAISGVAAHLYLRPAR